MTHINAAPRPLGYVWQNHNRRVRRMTHFVLTLILHIFIGSTLAGSGVIAALSMGYTGLMPILVSAGLGFLLAFPVSWFIARRITSA